MHHILDVFLVLVTASLFTLLVKVRPGAKPLSRPKLIGLFIVGAIIGVIFMSTHGIYDPATSL